ncbi:MAG: hypothetical protein Q9201_002537 [Fulgogasparrea decipioides]
MFQRPFVNYYGPTFILYELSSPFLNFHWFFDKLHMTGSRPQWYNGILLLASFFLCRLLWGTYQSLRVYQDCWAALHVSTTNTSDVLLGKGGDELGSVPTGIPDLMQYHPQLEDIPTWLALTYLGSNVVLNTLNFYWFGKMIETVKKRFRTPPKAKDEKEEKKEDLVVVEGVELDAGVVEGEEGMDGMNKEKVEEAMDGEVKEGRASGRDGNADVEGEVRRRRSFSGEVQD